MVQRRRNHWGWGYEDQRFSPEQVRAAAGGLATHLGLGEQVEVEDPVAIEALKLPAPRISPPAALAELCAEDTHARASHAWGKSYADVVRGFRGNFEHPPDFVAYPREEHEIEQLLEWCAAARVAAIPYGGGTSVVGGVRPEVAPSYNGAVSIDLSALDRVLEVDPISRAARIQAGANGPELERQLGEHGLTLRHFPQSFELATLGGWIATRAAGHFATVWTHIEDFVESVRALTPTGAWESRRLPGSGAGVSPDRMLAGSEGTLGVITEAWVRVQPRPTHRRSASVAFADFATGVECVRELSQSGLNPANCRLIDQREAKMTMVGDGASALLVIGFESTDHPVDAPMERALEICREHGGEASERGGAGGRGGAGSRGAGAGGGGAGSGGKTNAGGAAPDAVSTWRETFLAAPYLRDVFVAMGAISETFETAITWERFPAFHERVTAAAEQAMREVGAQPGGVSCRFTHIYPDGPAPYFTVLAGGGAGRSWSSGGRSSSRCRTRSSRREAQSPTTMRWAATTAPGMTASAPSRSRPRCAAQRRRSTRAGS